MTDFLFYREPRPEQRAAFERCRDAEFWAHYWDPRCGKSKVTYDEWRYNVELGRVDALLVIAYPSKAHLVWADEAPKDLPPEFLARTKLLAWRRGKMGTKSAQQEMDALIAHDGPIVLTMNCEAITTDAGEKLLRAIFKRRRVMLVVDEDWATAWTARTRRLLTMGKSPNCVMRRHLTGTPADEGPGDLYFPTQFLKPGTLGFTSSETFRHRYIQYKTGYNRRLGREYEEEVGVQNIEELREKLAAFSDRVERRGSERVYATRYFEMTDKQRRVYDQLKGEFEIELSRGTVSVPEALKRVTRLQTIARNYWAPEQIGIPCRSCSGAGCTNCDNMGVILTETKLERIDDRNPAADALVEELAFSHRPFVVWCARLQEVQDALTAARTIYQHSRVAQYDGTVPDDLCVRAYKQFQDGSIDGIVATERSSLSRSHDLRRATLICFYANEWALRHRRQAEARGDDFDNPSGWTDIVDLAATDTRDVELLDALRGKKDLAEAIVPRPKK